MTLENTDVETDWIFSGKHENTYSTDSVNETKL